MPESNAQEIGGAGVAGERRTLQNCTPHRLLIHGSDDAVLTLAPLERGRVMDSDALARFPTERLQLCNYVAVRPIANDTRVETIVNLIPTIGFLYLIGGGVVASDVPHYWLGGGSALVLGFLLALFVASRGTEGARQSAIQAVSLLLATATAVAIPAAIIYLFGGGNRIFDSDRDLLALGRGLQFLFITLASLLPALLYYLFDRQQLATLRERFEQQIFRFDPDVSTLSDVHARYGRQMEEIFGPSEGAGRNRLNRAKQWPIIVATLVITIGWILTLAPVHQAATPPAVGSPGDLLSLFVPQSEPMVWGFLGAYFFALQTVLHRYVRRDLKPSAYASVTVRVFIVLILSWVLSPLPWDMPVGVFLFLVGVMPETGVALIQEQFRSRTGLGWLFPSNYSEEHPLTRLEGIGLYDRARLEDEGVTNVQSLAHHDLIDLMIETRIPVPRLVDWVDQAILYLHLCRIGEDGKNGFPWVRRFAQLGIRTATDLLRVYDAATDGGTAPRFSIATLLASPGEEIPDAREDDLHALVASLRDDEWLRNIRFWREPAPVREIRIRPPHPSPDEPEPARVQAFVVESGVNDD